MPEGVGSAPVGIRQNKKRRQPNKNNGDRKFTGLFGKFYQFPACVAFQCQSFPLIPPDLFRFPLSGKTIYHKFPNLVNPEFPKTNDSLN